MRTYIKSVLGALCPAVMALSLTNSDAWADANFTPVKLPFVTGEFISSDLNDISADGSIVVGNGGPIQEGQLLTFRSGVGHALGKLSPVMRNTSGTVVSGNGEVIYGRAFALDTSAAFRWTLEKGFEDFPYEAEAINFDGSVVAGQHEGRAFRWTEATGLEYLGDLGSSEDGIFSTVITMSRDGATIVGHAYKNVGQKVVRRPFIWTQENGFKEMPIALSGDVTLNDISSDANIVIGSYFPNDRDGGTGFFWNRSRNQVTLLDKLPAPSGWSVNGMVPQFTNHDGSVIIGFQGYSNRSFFDSTLFIWRADIGTKNLIDVLNAEEALGYNGQPLTYLRGFSKDGSTIYGVGKGAFGRPKDIDPWMIKIDQARFDIELRTSELSIDVAQGQTAEWQLSADLLTGAFPTDAMLEVTLPQNVKVIATNEETCTIADSRQYLQCPVTSVENAITLTVEATAPGDEYAKAALSANGFDADLEGNTLQTRFRVSGTPTSVSITSPSSTGRYNNKTKIRFDADATGFDGEDLSNEIEWFLNGEALTLDANKEALVRPGYFRVQAKVTDSADQVYSSEVGISVERIRDITANIWTSGFWIWKKTNLSWRGNKGPVDIYLEPDCSGWNQQCTPFAIVASNVRDQSIKFDFYARNNRFKICEAGTDLDAEDAEDFCSEDITIDGL